MWERGSDGLERQAMPDNAAAALCYLAMPFSAVALLAMGAFRGRPFVRFHALQAMFTFGAIVAAVLAMPPLAQALFLLPWIGVALGGAVLVVVPVAFLGLWIWLMLQALQGKRCQLPWVGRWLAAQMAA